MNPDFVLQVFARAPVAGQVKTRLIPGLGEVGAAEMAKGLMRKCLDTLSSVSTHPMQLWCTPDTDHDFFQDCQNRYHLTLHRQRGADLGQRMRHALESVLDDGSNALLIGCDCPSLTPADLLEASQALAEGADVVIGPAEDGGYVLIGLGKPVPELFKGIAWGSDAVMSTTRERIHEIGLEYHQLTCRWDVDRPADLMRLRDLGLEVIAQ